MITSQKGVRKKKTKDPPTWYVQVYLQSNNLLAAWNRLAFGTLAFRLVVKWQQ